MAEHPHAQLVRTGYEAFSRGDLDTLRSMMTGDAAHHVPGSHQLSGDCKGDGLGHAVSMHHFTARRGDKRIDKDGAIVFRIVGGKTTDLDECLTDIDRADEFWS
ncbi:nuclear transport factor 2 family protein [Streptomyces sp. NPDC051172]|uniref:nuclear transport factor 2 family protein n=1 Tax=Streptomyces sp. NPDC051172 TaxID=3155796 RepID=UPI00341E8BD0